MPSDSSKFTLTTTCSFRPRICSYPKCTYYIRLERSLSWKEADATRILGKNTFIIRPTTPRVLHLKLAPFQGQRSTRNVAVDLDAAYGSIVKEISRLSTLSTLIYQTENITGLFLHFLLLKQACGLSSTFQTFCSTVTALHLPFFPLTKQTLTIHSKNLYGRWKTINQSWILIISWLGY